MVLQASLSQKDFSFTNIYPNASLSSHNPAYYQFPSYLPLSMKLFQSSFKISNQTLQVWLLNVSHHKQQWTTETIKHKGMQAIAPDRHST